MLKYASINWKLLESFEEVSSRQTLFGFRLSGATDYFEFYTKDEAALVYWLDHLSKFTINTDLREDYQLVGEISRGLRATVYKARDLLSGQKVAIKLVPKSSSGVDSTYLASIHHEVGQLRSLKHPNIVTLHRLYEDERNIALVLTYVGGLDLSKHILKSGKLNEAKARELTKRLLEVLAYLRTSGIVHNAVNPSNILLCSLQDLSSFRLCDFGNSTTAAGEYNPDLVSLAAVLTTVLTGKFAMQAVQTEHWSAALQDFLSRLSSKAEFVDPSVLLEHVWLTEAPPLKKVKTNLTSQLKKSLRLLKTSMKPEDLQRYLELANIDVTPEEISDFSDEEALEEDVSVNRPNVMSVSSNAI